MRGTDGADNGTAIGGRVEVSVRALSAIEGSIVACGALRAGDPIVAHIAASIDGRLAGAADGVVSEKSTITVNASSTGIAESTGGAGGHGVSDSAERAR